MAVTEEENGGDNDDNDDDENRRVIRNYFDTYYASTRIADTAWLVLEAADTLTLEQQQKNKPISIRQFTRYMFGIWRIFFLCVESVLSDVGGLFMIVKKPTSSPSSIPPSKASPSPPSLVASSTFPFPHQQQKSFLSKASPSTTTTTITATQHPSQQQSDPSLVV
ncbi:hypothetical protein BDB00DRAFT_838577 [Zychaea mexicana]|uniref:uncharacterized protein n=1 Tax=Zychaea mexicana TaxID=64656 RepID=UPI0022FE4386|nr:uncharacterized protein BDB00DRAFT_838577 [Zychaea mexicana]KAI9490300.1 hypothetical protein BDB00DRAFT_838577 [Zychaea mexicana]